MAKRPIIIWFRRDFRLADHPALHEALALGHPVLPLVVLDRETQSMGPAALWRWGLAVEAFALRLQSMGSRLILRHGPAAQVLSALLDETQAAGVLWSRSYDPDTMMRDASVKAMVKGRGLLAGSRPGFLLHEPAAVMTGAGGFYRVYTPFWNAVRGLPVDACLPAPKTLPGPEVWPASDDLAAWDLGAAMGRGAAVVRPYQQVGEQAAQARLGAFISDKVAAYKLRRDFMAEDASSGLSENLTYGEISPRQIWHAGQRAMHEGAAGAEHFLKELVWREFA